MTPTLFVLPGQDELARSLLRPLTRRGVAYVYWRTERDGGEAETYITDVVLEDADRQHVASTALRSGFLMLYAISDALSPDGGCFCLDVMTGRYRRVPSISERVHSLAHAGPPDGREDASAFDADLAS